MENFPFESTIHFLGSLLLPDVNGSSSSKAIREYWLPIKKRHTSGSMNFCKKVLIEAKNSTLKYNDCNQRLAGLCYSPHLLIYKIRELPALDHFLQAADSTIQMISTSGYIFSYNIYRKFIEKKLKFKINNKLNPYHIKIKWQKPYWWAAFPQDLVQNRFFLK